MIVYKSTSLAAVMTLEPALPSFITPEKVSICDKLSRVVAKLRDAGQTLSCRCIFMRTITFLSESLIILTVS